MTADDTALLDVAVLIRGTVEELREEGRGEAIHGITLAVIAIAYRCTVDEDERRDFFAAAGLAEKFRPIHARGEQRA